MSANAYLLIEKVVGKEYEPLASAVLVATGITALGYVALRQLRQHSNPIVPDETLTARNVFELVGDLLIKIGDDVMGKENRKFLPFLATLFFYLLFSNLLGLIPGFSMPTDSVTFNFGIAIVVFILYNFWGVREVGPINYVKHLWGPIWWLGPLLLPIELISHVFRPATLSLRLFGNMTGDHLVLEIFTVLTSNIFVPVPVIFYCFGTFICFLQAFIFTLLTMIYIRLAVAHEEEHH